MPNISSISRRVVTSLALMAAISFQARAADTPLNLLFIGNSFTQGGPIADLVSDFATDAGWATPQVQYVAPGGQSLNFHTTNTATLDAIGLGGWDYVVLQEFSTNPTDNAGNPAAFKSSATTLYDLVKLSSPDAQVLLYETWARHPDHSIYPGTFTDPAQMQSQLRTHYNDAADTYIPANSTAAVTTDVSVAPAGDAWENSLNTNGSIRLHAQDDYHAGNNGKYLSSAVIYSSIYNRSVAGRSNLIASPADVAALQASADATTGMTIPGGPTGVELMPPAAGASILIDLGADTNPTGGNWNNLNNSTSGSGVNLVDDSGATTSVDVGVTDGFLGLNSAGTATNALGYPTTASSDSFYTGSFTDHATALTKPAQVTISDLDPNTLYDITLYASRTGTDSGRGRLTRYTIDGQWQDLEVSDNTSAEILFDGIAPTAGGTLTLDIGVSPDGTARFAYLGILKITAQAIPEPASASVALIGMIALSATRRRSSARQCV